MFERLEPVTIRDQFPHLRFHQPKHESFGESLNVTLDRLIENLGLNTI